MSPHLLFITMLRVSSAPYIPTSLGRFPRHAAKEEGSNMKQQENEAGNACQIYRDQIAINIWNKARNYQTHKTL